MSHFSVLVIGPDVEGQLAPYHEFECTGNDDQYVQTIDTTDEDRAAYEKDTVRRLVDPEGYQYDPYADRFYRDPTPEEVKEIGPIAGTGGNARLFWTSKHWDDGKGYRTKIHQIPSGWSEVEIPASNVQSFTEWVKDWHGYEEVEEGQEPDLADRHKYGYVVVHPETRKVVRVIRRTNPNRKWDWYEIGGRYKGHLHLKSTPHAKSLLLKADQALKGDIDFDRMRYVAGEEARAEHRKAHAVIQRRSFPSWSELVGDNTNRELIHAMREVYWSHPVIDDLSKAGFYFDTDRFLAPESEYVARAVKKAIATFAVVKDSQWYERGKMGWWGCVSDEKDEDEWLHQFDELVNGLPDDTLLTVVDCHT